MSETLLFSGTDGILKMLAMETRAKQDWDTLRTALAIRVGSLLSFYRTKEAEFPLLCRQQSTCWSSGSCVWLGAQYTFKGTVEDLARFMPK